MTVFVVDTSVAVKWFVPEIHTERASSILASTNRLHAPDLLPAEFGNTLWKKFRRDELDRAEVQTVASALPVVPINFHSSIGLLRGALEIAFETSGTVCDSLYVCLAIALDCQFVTADEKLCNALQSTELSARVLHVGDV